KGESSLPDPSEKENESNEILNVSEIIVEEEKQESEFPERPEIFTWLLSLDKKKPPHEETEDFVKRALERYRDEVLTLKTPFNIVLNMINDALQGEAA
ncbi:TPA: transcriptional regulator, partial [Escherichia coli]